MLSCSATKSDEPQHAIKQMGPVEFLRQLLVAACGRVSSDRPGFVRVRSARREEQSSLGGGVEGPTLGHPNLIMPLAGRQVACLRPGAGSRDQSVFFLYALLAGKVGA